MGSEVDEILESGLMPTQAYNIFNKIAKSDDEREALSHLSFDCPTERDLFFQINTSLIDQRPSKLSSATPGII
jgi:hypothetical protein